MSISPIRTTEARRTLTAAAAAAALVAGVFYVAFGPGDPFAGTFEIKAEVRNAAGLRSGSPVRVAGQDIGTVAKVRAGRAGVAEVVMRLDEHRGMHADASLTVRPRLLLEGNDYVDLRPGTPSAPPLQDGALIPLRRTASTVQLDQLLSTFTQPTRHSLRSLTSRLARILGKQPRGRTSSGASRLRRSTRALASALPSFTRVALAVRGQQDADLRGLVTSTAGVAGQLAARPADLQGIVDDYSSVVGVLARRADELGATVDTLAAVLRHAPSRLRSIDAALPQLAAFSEILRPALRRAPRALNPAAAALTQLRLAVAPSQLPLLLRRLRPATAALPPLTVELREAVPLLDSASRCIDRNVVPTLDKQVPDGPRSTGRPAWQDLLHMAAALTGTSPGFDGDGGTLRVGISEGANTIRGVLPGIGPVVSSANLEGVAPRWLGPGRFPQFRPDVRCAQQPLPDLTKRRAPGLPAGLQRVARPTLSPQQALRKSTILRGLFGAPRDRRALLRLFERDLPRVALRPAPPVRRIPGRSSLTPTATDPAVVPAQPGTSTPKPSLTTVANDLADAVDGLLGTLLGGRPR